MGLNAHAPAAAGFRSAAGTWVAVLLVAALHVSGVYGAAVETARVPWHVAYGDSLANGPWAQPLAPYHMLICFPVEPVEPTATPLKADLSALATKISTPAVRVSAD